MEQVAVLADDAGARSGVSSYEPKRAESPGSASNRASASSRACGMDGDVGVEEEDQGGCGDPGPEVACGGGPLRSGVVNNRRPRRFGQRRPSRRSSRRRRRSARNRSPDESRSRWRQRSKSRPPFRTGTTTESDGLRGPGLAGPAGTSSMIHPRPSELDTRRNASPSVGSPEHVPSPHGDGTGRIDRRGLFEVYVPAEPTQHSRDVRRKCSRNRQICQSWPRVRQPNSRIKHNPRRMPLDNCRSAYTDPIDSPLGAIVPTRETVRRDSKHPCFRHCCHPHKGGLVKSLASIICA